MRDPAILQEKIGFMEGLSTTTRKIGFMRGFFRGDCGFREGATATGKKKIHVSITIRCMMIEGETVNPS